MLEVSSRSLYILILTHATHRMEQSAEPETIISPSELNATVLTLSECPSNAIFISPVEASHSLHARYYLSRAEPMSDSLTFELSIGYYETSHLGTYFQEQVQDI